MHVIHTPPFLLVLVVQLARPPALVVEHLTPDRSSRMLAPWWPRGATAIKIFDDRNGHCSKLGGFFTTRFFSPRHGGLSQTPRFCGSLPFLPFLLGEASPQAAQHGDPEKSSWPHLLHCLLLRHCAAGFAGATRPGRPALCPPVPWAAGVCVVSHVLETAVPARNICGTDHLRYPPGLRAPPVL